MTFPLFYILQGPEQRAEWLTRALSILLILYENKYLDMEIPGTTMYFYRKKEERKKTNPKDLFQVAAV